MTENGRLVFQTRENFCSLSTRSTIVPISEALTYLIGGGSTCIPINQSEGVCTFDLRRSASGSASGLVSSSLAMGKNARTLVSGQSKVNKRGGGGF